MATKRKAEEQTPDLKYFTKSRYYDLFLEWLNCCKEYDPNEIIGKPFEKSLFKAFKNICTTFQMLIDNPDQISSIDFKYRGICIRYKASLAWKYPQGNELIYDPDQVIDQIKNQYID